MAELEGRRNCNSGIWQRSVTPPRPFLRWAGSKRQIVSQLASYWRSHFARYVEPFAGSSCLFFHLAPEKAVLSDKNRELIECYEVLRDDPLRLYERVASLPRTQKVYTDVRDERAMPRNQFDRAVRFLYLNRNCFNGIYRTNMSGKFNVPWGGNDCGALPTVQELCACARLLAGAELRVCDFGRTLRWTGEGDFVYLDPPYAVQSRRIFREYGPRAFSVDDLGRLAGHLDRMNERGARFLVSYADCREARQLFAKWQLRRIRVRRNVAGFSGDRRTAFEVLATNIQEGAANDN
jgi:DNA adenine methylase